MKKKRVEGLLAEQLMAQKYRLERYTEDELIKLYTSLNLVRDEILRGWGKTITTEYSQTRALAMVEEARELMDAIKPKIEERIASTLGKMSEESAKVYSEMITFGGKAKAAQVAFLSAEQMAAYWKYTPVGGQLLKDWVSKTFDGPTTDRIQREIFAGMFQGEGYREMAKRLQDGFVITRREAETLVRTYVHSANVHAMKEVYGKNRDIIAGVRWLTAFDKRTCMRCAALSGKIFPLDDHPACPLHPRCRCVLVPETDISKLKVQPKVAEDWAKGLKTKPPGLYTVLTPDGVPKTDFRRWILSRPEKDQLAFFGKKRYALIKEGKIGWNDLFEETRLNGKESVRLRLVDELLAEREVLSGSKNRVAAHIVDKNFYRDARDWFRHKAMADSLDERAIAQAVREASYASELFAKGDDIKAKDIGGRALEKIIRGFELQGKKYDFKGIDMDTDLVAKYPNYPIRWMAATDPTILGGGKIYLRNDHTNAYVMTKYGEWTTVRYRTSETIMRALEKIYKDQPLSFTEEYSLTILLHETGHTRTIATGNYLEMMNEWKARRETPAFIKRLGGASSWAEEIKKRGYGYSDKVANFDILLKHLDVSDDEELLDKISDICINKPQDTFKKELISLLEGKKGKKALPLPAPLPEVFDKVFEFRKPKNFIKWLEGED